MRHIRPILAALVAAASFAAGRAPAQIVLDGSLGTAGELPPDAAGEVRIGADLGARSGPNLFHSFERFDVAAGTSAAFLGEPDIARVIARVTGPGTSHIDGILRSDIPGADLYLLNPHGVIFGSGASLSLTGSFYVGSAQRLQFRGGESFAADDAHPVTLSSEPPEAWGFSSPVASSAIEVDRARLDVESGRVLSLVAPALRIGGAGPGTALLAPAGRIELAAEAGPVEIALASLDVSSDQGAGTVSIRARDLEMRDVQLYADNLGDAAAKPVAIDIAVLGDVSISGDSAAGGSDLTAEVFGAGDGGEVSLAAGGRIELGGDVIVASLVRAGGATGSSGRLRVRADRLVLTGGAQLHSTTRSEGVGGDIGVVARRIEIDGLESLLGSVAEGSGEGGDVEIAADEIEVSGGGQIVASARGSGPGGDLDVRARDILVQGAVFDDGAVVTGRDDGVRMSSIQVEEQPEEATGIAGSAAIHAERIVVRDGGEIGRFSLIDDSQGPAEPAGLSIHARELVVEGQQLVSTREKVVIRPALVTTSTRQRNAGPLRIRAERVEVRDGGQISATTSGRGNAGDLEIVAPEIELRGAGDPSRPTGIFSLSETDRARPAIDGGDAGNVILATRSLQVGAQTRIEVSTQEPSQGGSLRVDVPEDLARLAAEGADPEWATTARVQLDGGALLAEAGSAEGPSTGGEIRIHANQLVLEPGSRISAVNHATGDSGNIEIVTSNSLRATGAQVSTESAAGLGGNIAIRAGRLVYLQDSGIETSVTSGAGSGGNISIDPELVVLNRSAIRANADAGNGGDVSISAERFVRSADSVVEASSNTGIDGEISILSPVEDLEEETARIEASYLDASDLLGPGCGAHARSGSLTRVGRAPVAGDPDARLSPRSVASDAGAREESCVPPR